jgi:hypothetical protein
MGVFFDARSGVDEAVGGRKAGTLPNPKWWRVVLGFAIALGLFLLALYLESTAAYAEASKTALHLVEVTVTAVLALLGIEAAKA